MIEYIKNMEFSLGDILSDGWSIYRKHFRTILLIVLIVYIPINILLSFIPVDAMIQEQGLKGLKTYVNIVKISEVFIGVLATMAIAFVVESSLLGQDMLYGEALRKSASRWLSVIGTSILGGIIVLGLSLLLIVPGIIWSVYYIFAIYVVSLRNIRGKEALDYSKSVVKGHWWKVFCINLFFGLLNIIIGLVIGLVYRIVPDILIINIATDTLCDIIGAFITVAHIIFFLNLDYCKNEVP